MKKNILIILTLLVSCASKKNINSIENNIDNARMYVLQDYLKIYSNKDTLRCKIRRYDIDSMDFYIIKFNKLDFREEYVAPQEGDTIGAYTYSFPTRYYEINHKLFYWHDKNVRLSTEIIQKLQAYKCIDSALLKNTPFIISNAPRPKSIWYFVCKNDITKFKKRKDVWVRKEEYPNLKCPK